MSAWIESVCPDDLSKILRGANVVLTAREARILDAYQRTSFETWVAYNDGKLVAAWGIIPPTILSDEVYLWLHTTQAVTTSQFLFVRHSQIIMQKLLTEYRAVTGHVKADARHSQRWLQWLGAEFGPPVKGMRTFRIERHG